MEDTSTSSATPAAGPPYSCGTSRPSRPLARSAARLASGNTASRSTAAAFWVSNGSRSRAAAAGDQSASNSNPAMRQPPPSDDASDRSASTTAHRSPGVAKVANVIASSGKTQL